MYVRLPLFSPSAIPYTLFIFFFVFYLIFNSGHLGAYDAAMEYEVTRNLLRYGSFDLRDEQFNELDAARGIDGRLYSPHGPGQSIAMIPFFLLGEGVAVFLSDFPAMRIHHFFISLMNPLITAFICVFLFLLQKRLGFSKKTSILTTYIYGIGTLAFPYSKISFDVTLTACLLIIAAYALVRFRQSVHLKWALLAGVLLGCALVTRIATLIVLPFFAIYLCCCLREKTLKSFFMFRVMCSFCIPIIFSIVIIGWYNTIRFGFFYEDGHAADAAVAFTTPLIVGFIGQLLSPGKGLFFYSSILLFAVSGVRMMFRSHRLETLFFISIILVNLLFYSKLASWSGDWCWGPRFTVPIIPFLCLFLGAFLNSDILQRRAGLKRVWIIILVLSFTTQILGVTLDGARRIGRRYMSGSISTSQVYWIPTESPLIDHTQLLLNLSSNATYPSEERSIEIDKVTYEDTTADFWFVYFYSLGFPLKILLGCIGILTILEIYSGYSILRSFRLIDKTVC